jgi:hypothetical protein
MNFLLLLLLCCCCLQSRASKEDSTSWESNQSWTQTQNSKSIWSTEVGEGMRQSGARIRFWRNGTREWSEGGDSSMILRAWYWGTRLCHCMECMVKNARQGIDQSHGSRSNIHMTFLWSVNKPRVPFPFLPRVYFTYYPLCFVPGKLPASLLQFSSPRSSPRSHQQQKKLRVSKNWNWIWFWFSKSKCLLKNQTPNKIPVWNQNREKI